MKSHLFKERINLTPGVRAFVNTFAENPVQGIENISIEENVAAPDTENLEPTDILIAVKSVAVGWVDLLMTSGQYQHMPPLPYTPGLEYSGVVAWVGAQVERCQVGDSVLVDAVYAGPRSKGNYQSYGGFASYAVVPENAVIKIPENLSFEQACNLLGNYETAYYCLVSRGRLKAGETVLILGASGATGLAAVQVAKAVGAKVIAAGRSIEKLAKVKEEGADEILLIKKEEEGAKYNFREQVKEMTGGSGVQVVYDGVGGEVSVEALRCLDFAGRFVIVGWAATPYVAKGKGERGAPHANLLPTNIIMMKGLDVLGSPTVITTHRNPEIRKERLEQLMKWLYEGKLKPFVSHVFPFSKLKEAMHAKWENKTTGGCVVNLPDL